MGELFQVDPGLSRSLTHGFHSYAGRMHPSTARTAIAALTKPGQQVFDPFCGSGTVLVESMAAGRTAAGVDASPLAVLIAKVRTTLLDDASREQMVIKARAISEEASERARKRIRPEIPAWARRENQRFSPHVALELLGLREILGLEKEDAVGYALRACFSSILVKFMRSQETESSPGEGERRIGRGVPSSFFARRVEELSKSLAALEHKTPSGTRCPKIHLGDARKLNHVADGSCDLILSSPPYAGTYDYAEHHDVRFLWLGLPREDLDRKQVGARSDGLGSPEGRWRKDRQRWLGEMRRVVRPRGTVVLVVGDGVVGGRAEDAAEAIAEHVPQAGLRLVAIASQSRPTRDRRLSEIFKGLPRREHMVMLRRE
jgi:hypothetical protein